MEYRINGNDIFNMIQNSGIADLDIEKSTEQLPTELIDEVTMASDKIILSIEKKLEAEEVGISAEFSKDEFTVLLDLYSGDGRDIFARRQSAVADRHIREVAAIQKRKGLKG